MIKYLYHAGNVMHELPEQWGEGYHYTDDIEDLKSSMSKMRDKSIIIRYPVKARLNCLKITGDMNGWFGPSLAELLLAKLDNREIEDEFVSDNPVDISKLNINVREEDREELQSIKDSYDNTKESFNKVFKILNKYGFNCIEYDYYEGSSKAYCIADINLLDLDNAKIVYRKKEMNQIKETWEDNKLKIVVLKVLNYFMDNAESFEYPTNWFGDSWQDGIDSIYFGIDEPNEVLHNLITYINEEKYFNIDDIDKDTLFNINNTLLELANGEELSFQESLKECYDDLNFMNSNIPEVQDVLDDRKELMKNVQTTMDVVNEKDTQESNLGISKKNFKYLPDEKEFPEDYDAYNKATLDESLFEAVDDFNVENLKDFVYDKIVSVLDNIAVEANSKVPGYSADWCADEQPAYIEDAILSLVDSTIKELLTYKD